MTIFDRTPAIEFRNVSKTFPRHADQRLIRTHLARLFHHKRHEEPFFALKDVTFGVMPGESLAIVGANGAGKSTLLSLVAGLAPPNRGEVVVQGRVAALLELGSGFHPDLTGAENVRLNASLMGLSRQRTDELFEEIVDFAGIRDFINEPLRTYSSGMIVRLAFSVAVHTDPEVLLIDEVLVVGDQTFQAKCHDKILQLRQRGKTLLCVSHSVSLVQSFCDSAIWLDHGQLIMKGTSRQVIEAYSGFRTAAV
jgi:ABC-type polysaccharide/polyol phosphate transport system ATPase subunit